MIPKAGVDDEMLDLICVVYESLGANKPRRIEHLNVRTHPHSIALGRAGHADRPDFEGWIDVCLHQTRVINRAAQKDHNARIVAYVPRKAAKIWKHLPAYAT